MKKNGVVLSADVVGSSKLKPHQRKKMQRLLDNFFKEQKHRWPDLKAQQFRGDSIQVVMTTHRLMALRIGMLLQTALAKENFNIRVSIGIGEISFRGKDIITSDGSAFRTSGPALDELKKTGEIISIGGNEPEFTSEWQVHSASLNFIMQRWSPAQAEAVYLQLQHLTQQKIAKKIKIKQPSVHQRLQTAGIHAVNKILQRFESVVASL